jgi:hypothetical protein
MAMANELARPRLGAHIWIIKVVSACVVLNIG